MTFTSRDFFKGILEHDFTQKLSLKNSKRGSSVLGKGSSSWPLLMTLALSSVPGQAEPGTTASTTSAKKPQPTRVNIQEVKAANGLTAWMVESHEIPVVSVAIAFRDAGNAADPKGLAGLVRLLTSTLDEGAGPWDSQGFKKFLLEKNIELHIAATNDTFQLNFRTIKENVGEAFRVLNLVLRDPKFDDESLSRVKNQILTSLEQSLHNENFIAHQTLNSLIFGDHPYGRTAQQILKEFPKITATQMRQFIKDRLTRDQIVISAVGDITSNELKDYLDKTFGDFPEKSAPSDLKNVALLNLGTTTVETLDIPQSLVYFTQPGITRDDPDFYAAVVMMKIMGDGDYESRLWNEVREKRGLTYGIQADVNYSKYASLLIGGTSTKNNSVQEVVTLIRKVWKDMSEGASQAELDFVKKRMVGSFALNFSSTHRIAKALVTYQMDKLGTDYINKRNEIISSLTLEQINKVAKRLLNPEKLTFIIVGKPEKLTLKETTITPCEQLSKGPKSGENK
jgi:zinc protease